jgi:acetyl esterase
MTNSVVISINYQKAPEHKFPIPFNDCYEGLQWVIANAKELNIKSDKIGVGGDSAGGNLASAVALAARDRGVKLAYQLLIYPCNGPEYVDSPDVPNAETFGLTQRGMKWLWEQYLNGPVDRTNPYAVPHSAKSYEGLAPAVIFTAEYDVLRQDGIDYAAKLKAAGVPTAYIDCPGMIHGFFNYGKYIDEGIKIRTWIAAEINKVLGK